MVSAIAAVVIRREREVVQALRDARAMSPASARTLGELGLSESNALRRLRRRAVIRETGDGRFYLDDASWEALIALRRRLAIVAVIVVLVLLFFTLGVVDLLR